MWSNNLTHVPGHLLATTVPPDTATTATFSGLVGAFLIVLAIYGALCLIVKSPPAKALVILLLAGIVIVYVSTLLQLGENVRDFIADAAVNAGYSELTGELTFTLAVLLSLVLTANYIKGRLRTPLLILLSLALFTLSWAQVVVVAVIEKSTELLSLLSGVGV